jgi:hypothetical protein
MSHDARTVADSLRPQRSVRLDDLLKPNARPGVFIASRFRDVAEWIVTFRRSFDTETAERCFEEPA